jgi:hypothetical protein
VKVGTSVVLMVAVAWWLSLVEREREREKEREKEAFEE